MDDCFIFIKGQAPGTWDRRFAFLAAESFSREVMKRQSNYLISTNSSFEVFVHRSTTIQVPKVCRPSLELANLEQRTFCHHHSRHKFTHAFTHSFIHSFIQKYIHAKVRGTSSRKFPDTVRSIMARELDLATNFHNVGLLPGPIKKASIAIISSFVVAPVVVISMVLRELAG
mmetsp:Transcript_16140/g.31185  ORF Transcript_16140/g.31185 Transcript_16140/m.31185 type:complete len:172 (-) Transcript_16140:677-1192(-)